MPPTKVVNEAKVAAGGVVHGPALRRGSKVFTGVSGDSGRGGEAESGK